jgi:hypothetical protein
VKVLDVLLKNLEIFMKFFLARGGRDIMLDIARAGGQKWVGVAKYNLRFIFAVAALVIVLLVGAFAIWIGYEAAASHAIGRYAPFGQPTNFKHKPVN